MDYAAYLHNQEQASMTRYTYQIILFNQVQTAATENTRQLFRDYELLEEQIGGGHISIRRTEITRSTKTEVVDIVDVMCKPA